MPAGSEVQFTNSDSTSHHVYSFSRPNAFALPLYKGNARLAQRFEQPGVVVLGCNIHDSMLGYIVVVDSSRSGVTGADGRVTLPDVPAGRHIVRAWAPGLDRTRPPEVGVVDVSEAAPASLAFQIDVAGTVPGPKKRGALAAGGLLMNGRLSIVLAALAGLPLAAPADDRHVLEGAMDVSAISVSSPFTPWLDEGEGKLRYDDDDGALQFSRAFLEYQGRVTSTLVAHGVLNFQDTKDQALDLTEAYLEWRPVPRTPWRVRSRIGAFYPKLSLENVDAGWSSPYALSSSAINTWIGEELRTVGAEVRVSRVLSELPLSPELAFEGAIFYGNDPTGAMLNWRGWSLHDRQTGLTSALPLPEIPAIEPWAPVTVLRERPEALPGDRPRSRLLRRRRVADGRVLPPQVCSTTTTTPIPEALSGTDYAWQTRFDHIGLQFTLPGEIGVISQWIDGITRMGPDLGPWHVWDSGFDSRFLMLTRAFGRHRLSARYDDFDVHPYNDPDMYTNRDHGDAWTASWLFDWTDHVRLGAEYLAIATEHCETEQCAWVFNGLPRTSRQNQLQLSLRWQFRSTW